MAELHVKVKDGKFDPESQRGEPGDTVKFENERGSSVTVDLDPDFYSTNQIQMNASGNKNVTIKSTAEGTGVFSTTTVNSKKRDTMNGEVVIQPRR
ncbi:MAG TPA: hypothetical protein VIG99_01840 [Myxococcaceae bacterium]